MILSENYVKIPGKQYKVKVQCVSTRRLTTMEWLIVNCADRFHDSVSTGKLTLKYVFEEIFQLTSSEILIKPCIESLLMEQAILLDAGRSFEYNSLTFSQIRLTDKGKRMAEDGLFPGASRELPLDIYYNPLTEKMNQFVGGNEQIDDAIDFGTPSDYSMDFPEDKVIEALHKGLVGRGKFVASKLRIESIDCMTSTDWDDYVKIEVETADGERIFTKPQIKEENVKSLISNLLLPKEITEEKIRDLIWIEEAQPKKILGAGKRIKESFLSVAKNGSFLGMQSNIYALYKRNISAFKGKCILLWDEKKFCIQKENDFLAIMLPFSFDVPGCVIVNEKNESLSVCKKKYTYEERDIFSPIAVEDKRIIVGGNDLAVWIEKIVEDNYLEEIGYLSLYSLPGLENRKLQIARLLENRWHDSSIDNIIEDLSILAVNGKEMNSEMVSLDAFGDFLWAKLSGLSTEEVLNRLAKIVSFGCIKSGSETQNCIVKEVIQRVQPPQNYNELMILLQAIGIRSREEAIIYNSLIPVLYTHELFVDAINVIVCRKYSKLPELFAPDTLFNEYYQAITGLEFLISGLDLFAGNDIKQIEKSIDNCPDIALIQSYTSTIFIKNNELLDYGVNVYNEMSGIDVKKADCFYTNIETIRQKVEAALRDDSRLNGESRIESNGIVRTVYIIDTCAIVHNPDLFLYFKDDDYVRIPTKVIDELGKIKDGHSTKYSFDLSKTAARVAADLETKYLKLFNSNNKLRLMIENADVDLLPPDLDGNVPDNQILSVALKYKGWNAVIISDDGVFRLASLSQNIQTIKSSDFMKENEIYKRSLERWIEKYKKEGGKFNSISGSQGASNNHSALIEYSFKLSDVSALDIDELPIKELKKFIPKEISDQVIAFILNNGIKTIGQFRRLSKRDVEGFKAKGRQVILKNNVARALETFDKVIVKKTFANENEQPTAESDEKPDNVEEAKIEDAISEGNTSEEAVSEDLATKINEDESDLTNSKNEEHDSADNSLGEEERNFVNFLMDDSFDNAMIYYLSLTSKANKHEQAVVFRRILSFTEIEEYTPVMNFIMKEFPDWQIKQVIGYVDLEVKDRVIQNTDWRSVITGLVTEKEFGKLGVLLNEWNVEVDYDNWFANTRKEDVLLQINTSYSIEKYLNECLENDEEKILNYLMKDLDVPSKLLTTVCIKNITNKNEKASLYVKLMCSHFNKMHAAGKKVSLSLSNIVDVAIALPESAEDELKDVVEKCTTGKYCLVANRHYAQVNLTPKTMEPLAKMIDAKLATSRIVYVYMNTKLRGEINVDRFIVELVAAGYAEFEVLELLKDYWLLGKIKYIQDDGLIRVAAESISNSRLMVFRSDRIHINGEDGFVEPREGMQIYYKLQDYKEGGQFYIHYPCTDIAYTMLN